MAPVRVRIPGQAGIIEANKARLAAAVQQQFNVVTASPQNKPRRTSAGDLGKRLQTARLV
jgi:hypothetical protein